MRLISLILCCCLVGGMVHDCGVTPEWEKQLMEEVESARRLQVVPAFKRSSSLGPLRIVPYYYDTTQFDATVSARVKDVIMPSVLKWYSNMLSVYNLDENWKMTTTSCTGLVTVPAEHLNPGLPNVDLVIYVISINDSSKGYIAKGGFCAQDGNLLQNPTAGLLLINSAFYAGLSTDMEITVLRHEVMHILGFSNSLFSKFRKPDGSLYDSTSTTTVLRDSTVTMLTTPIVTSKARAAYNCNTLMGFELENYGSTGTASSHWEKRIILNDFMMSTLTMDAVYSDVSLAVLEDSGWYKVDYSYTDPIVFGRDKNCDFFTRKCVAGGIAQFSDFCVTPSNNECSTSYMRKASCNVGNWTAAPPTPYQYFSNPLTAGMDSTADFCPFRDPFGNGDCKNRGSIATFYQPVLFGEQLCDTCMCFTGTYILQYRVIANPLHSGCHSVVCDNGVAKVTIASNQITCPVEGGQVSNIPGYPGYINCPPYERLCGDRPCLNGCFGYGKCVRGSCQCNDGYSLIDCSLICHETCRKCTGKTNAECTSCYPNAHLSAGTCICNDGFAYNFTQQRCSPCHVSCLTCSALTEYDCVTCVPHATKAASGTCVCDPGYTRSSDGSTCVPCYPTCATCSGTGINNCVSCRANAAIAGGAVGACSCNSGYYLKADYMCGACHVSCKECTSDIASSCTACKPQTAAVSNGFCVCPAYFYLSADGAQCVSCHITCYTCTGSSASSCLTCKAPTATVTAGVCNCPLGFYLSADAANCLSCDVTCKGCVAAGPTACSSCKPLTAILSNGVCSCPARYYMTSDGVQCLQCDVNCSTCIAAGSTSCTSCYPLATLSPLSGPGSCLCADRFYYQPPSGCLPCHFSCKTCLGASSTQCVTCNAGPAVSSECKCVNGQFMSQTGDCQPCSANCVTCVDTSTKCTTCNPAVSTLVGITCQCLSSAFLSASTLCVPCHVTCLTCTGNASTECSSCVANATLQSGSCPCSPGFTRSATLTQCVPCHHTCKECAGTQANQCTNCLVGAAIFGQAPWYCTCVDGYFTTSTGNCSICSVNCRTCTDVATKCTACDPAVAQLVNTVCTCIPGAYLSSTTACLTCDISCVTCIAGSNSACTSCAAFSHLSANPGTCLCDNSYFPNPTAKTCAHCETSCKECSGPSATDCKQCYQLASLTATNSCECNFGYFPFGSTADCRKCDRLCGNCVGAQPTDCIDCPKWARLAAIAPSYCLCKDGYFPDPDVANCSACDPSCGTCTGNSPFLCLTCANGYSWVSGLYCLSVCPAGHSSSTGSCAPLLPLGFRLQLDKVTQKPLDSVGLRITQSGSGADQDPSDPTAYYRQGWLFDGVEDYLALPGNLLDNGNIVLDSTHTVEAWIRPGAAGCVLSKSIASGKEVKVIYKLCVTGTGALQADVLTVNLADPSIQLTRTVSGGNVAFRTAWTAVSASLAFTSKSTTTLSISINQVKVSTATYTGEVFKDTPGSYDTVKFLAGATSGSTFGSYFKGHIAEISIWNAATVTVTAAGCGCAQCSTGGLCLSSCQATEYQSPTGCSACLSTCTSGCIRGTDCRMNVDPLCGKFTSFIGCDECTDLAVIENSACKCIVNTDRVGDDCRCQADYPRTGNQCGECRNYLDPAEVSAYFHSSYLLVIVAFQRPMVTAAVNSCGDVFAAETLVKMGEEATCVWAGDSLSIAVFLGTNPTIVNEQISLRSINLYAQTGSCRMTASVLRPVIAYIYPLPVPVAVLSLPNTFSIPCSTSGMLELDASGSYGGKGRPLNYTWSLSSADPPFSQMYTTTDSLLKVRKEVLLGGMLQVVLTVKNFAGGNSQASGQVLVTSGEALTIKIEGGDTFSLKSTDTREVNLNTFSLCPRNSTLLFTWSFLSTSRSRPNDLSFLQSNSPSDFITIPDHALPAGSSYRFGVDATDGIYNGGTVFTANVLQSDLVVALDRVDSDVDVGTDFIVSGANSTDPDNAEGTLSFLWTCLDGGKPCTDSNGTAVVVNAITPVLTLVGSRLKANCIWNVTLTVSKDTRAASKSLLLTIKSNVTTSFLNVYPTPSRLNSQQKNTISLAISALASTTFLWKQEIGSALPLLTPLTYPYLSIGAFAMKFGDTYGFALTATNAGGVSTARVAFVANYPPSGGSCTISPKTGIAISTVFEVVSSNWEDVEGDLPLYYTVVYLYKTYTITLGKTSLSSYFSFKSGIGTYDFYVFVWDSLKSYKQVPAGSITVSRARQLLAVNVLEAFIHDITDQDLIYQMALAYSSVFEFDNATLSGVVSALSQHIASVAEMDSSELDALLGTVSTLMQQPAANTTESLRGLLALIDSAIGKLQGTVSDQQLAVLLKLVETSAETEEGMWKKWAGGAVKALLPDQVPLKFSGDHISSYYQRLAALTLSKQNITFNHFRLSVPSGFLPYINFNSVFDLHLDVVSRPGNISDEISLTLYASGQFRNFAFEPLATPSELLVRSTATPLTIAFPVRGYQPNTTYECQHFSQGSGWVSDGMNLTSIDSETAVCSASLLSTFRVSERIAEDPSTPPPTTDPEVPGLHCNRNIAPIAMSFSLLFLGVLLVVYLKVVDPLKSAKVAAHWSEPHEFQVSKEPELNTESQAFKENRHTPTLSSAIPTPTEGPMIINYQESFQMTFSRLFCESHGIIGMWIFSTDLLRWSKAAIMTSAVLVEMSVIGAFSERNEGADNLSMGYIWDSYGWTDIRAVLVALAVGLGTSALLMVMFTIARRRKSETSESTITVVASAIAVAFTVTALAVTVLQALDLCFEEGGRWAIGAIGAVVGEVLVNQGLLALGRATALTALSR